MRKLTLNIDALDVQTFETTETARTLGTVHGAARTDNPRNCGDTSIADDCETGLCTPQTCPATFDSPDCTAAANGCA